MLNTYNSSTYRAEVEKLQTWGQYWPHSETLPQKQKRKEENKSFLSKKLICWVDTVLSDAELKRILYPC